MKKNARTIAARILEAIIVQQRSLSDVASGFLDQLTDPRERRLAQELSYGVLRKYEELETLIGFLLRKPLKKKDGLIKALLLIGAYQILYLRIPQHAAVSSVVDAGKQLGAVWARGLINGTLRNLIRQQTDLQNRAAENDSAKYLQPDWIIKKLQQDWPNDWQAILDANKQTPPMNLRVNARKTNRTDYLARLKEAEVDAEILPYSSNGIRLARTLNPQDLPGFDEGLVSVQDSAAQITAGLLDLKPDLHVLDACAAPGGKTAHILETEPNLKKLIAIDLVESRVALIKQSLQRLALNDDHVETLTANASDIQTWWDGQPFDRILLDAPCSATGVIRRHPDIKRHRQPDDIKKLVKTQATILETCWTMLASCGRLVYVTCSVFNDENRAQIAQFLSRHPDAKELQLTVDWGRDMQPGRQILPGEEGMDGFYYACLEKTQ